MKRTLGFALCMVAAAGCGSNTLTLRGIISAGVDDLEPQAGAEVAVLDVGLFELGSAVTDAQGVFEIAEVPRSEPVQLVVSGNGLVPLAFPGETGVFDPLVLQPGEVWALSEADAAEERARFDGCGADLGDGFVLGTFVYATGPNQDGNLTVAFDGLAWVELADGTRVDACYLDEDGELAPDADSSGVLGRYAVFGLPSGPLTLVAGRRAGGGLLLNRSPLYVPPGGGVMLVPTLIDL